MCVITASWKNGGLCSWHGFLLGWFGFLSLWLPMHRDLGRTYVPRDWMPFAAALCDNYELFNCGNVEKTITWICFNSCGSRFDAILGFIVLVYTAMVAELWCQRPRAQPVNNPNQIGNDEMRNNKWPTHLSFCSSCSEPTSKPMVSVWTARVVQACGQHSEARTANIPSPGVRAKGGRTEIAIY